MAMPSQITHLAIAKRFLEKHPQKIRDVQDFYDGNILPDLAPNKAVAHCGKREAITDLVKYNLEKVNPDQYLQTHSMNSDLERGEYLHLYVDYQFYNCFLRDYMLHLTAADCIAQSTSDMYETTKRDDAYLREKYGVDYQNSTYCQQLIAINRDYDAVNAVRRQQPGYHFVIPYDVAALDNFVEAMSDVDLP